MINFPTSPTDGQIFDSNGTIYVYNAAKSSWINTSSGGGGGGTTVTIDNDTTSATVFYPLFASASTGDLTVTKTASSKFTFVPETGQLTVVDLNTTSDLAYKEQVETIIDASDLLEKINGVSFNWKSTGRKSYGVIAQELQKLMPELVTENNEGLAVSYIPLIAILIQSLKEQNEKIRNLENKLGN